MNDIRIKTQPRRFGFLYENVVMRPAMVSQALPVHQLLDGSTDVY